MSARSAVGARRCARFGGGGVQGGAQEVWRGMKRSSGRAERAGMAIYHLSTKPVSRAMGRSATAAAAYRSGELVHDLTTDQVFDYTRKRGVEHAEIVLPTAAARADINWARDRQALVECRRGRRETKGRAGGAGVRGCTAA